MDKAGNINESELVNFKTLRFRQVKLEEQFQLYNLRTRSSVFNVLFCYSVPLYLISVYWANIFRSLPLDEVLIPCVVSTFIMVVLNVAGLFIAFGWDPEVVVRDIRIHFYLFFMGLSILFCYAIVFYIHGHRNLCHPTYVFNGICSSADYPTDMIFAILFLTVGMQMGFPSYCWKKAVILHICSIVTASVISPLYHTSLDVPVLILAIVVLTGTIIVRRRDAIRTFLLFLQIEKQKELEQQARLGERLRLMISGVAHDLKSPLSALSLGLEGVDHMQDEIYDVIHNVADREEQLKRADHLMANIRDISAWMENSKRAMTTIISRCVDVNQALNGLALTPQFAKVDVRECVESLIRYYRQENPKVTFEVSFDPALDKKDGKVETDPLWFRESVGCLVSNAVKFCDYSITPEGGHKVIVRIRKVLRAKPADFMDLMIGRIVSDRDLASPRQNAPNFLHVEVVDEGQGVDAESRKTLFTFLGHSQQIRVGGAGLGLGSLACRVKALGGTFGYMPRTKIPTKGSGKGGAESATGKGSIFWFEIPCAADPTMSAKDFNMEEAVVVGPNGEVISKPSTAPTQRNSLLRSGGMEEEDIVPKLRVSPRNSDEDIHKRNGASGTKITKVVPLDGSMHAVDEGCPVTKQKSVDSASELPLVGMNPALPPTLEVPKETSQPVGDLEDNANAGNASMHVTGRAVIDQAPISSKTEKLFGDIRKIRPLKILIVDDSMPIRKMCCMILQKQGHQVATAMNGKEALHLMKTACAEQWSTNETKTAMPLDLVLMDFQMPVMDGIEAVSLYRDYEKVVVADAGAMSPIHTPSRLAIVGMSACSDYEIIDRGLACGMDHFIGKPFQIQQLQPIMMQLFPHHVDGNDESSSRDEEELKHSEKMQQ